jgi:hypothetical protein
LLRYYAVFVPLFSFQYCSSVYIVARTVYCGTKYMYEELWFSARLGQEISVSYTAFRAAGIAKSVDSLMAGRSGVLVCVGARFSGPIQDRPRPTQPRGKWLPPVFSGGKAAGAWRLPPNSFWRRGRVWLEIPSVRAWHVMRLLYLYATAFKPTQGPTQPSS